MEQKNNNTTLENLQNQPLTEVVAGNSSQLLQRSIDGDEKAFQTVLRVAMQSTRNNDWVAFGDKPYLTVTGAQKMALRFGITLRFDRDKEGNAMILREEFDDPKYGRGYIYTTFGKAILGNREFEAIGTCSTLDAFLGMKDKETAMPLHESMQDAKKKSVSNFYNNAIQAVLGVKGFTWDELKDFGISKVGKPDSGVKSKKAPKEPEKPKPIPKGHGYWTSEFNGDSYIWAKLGNHFPQEFMDQHGMKESKTKGTFGRKYSPAIHEELEKQWNAFEAFQKA